MQKDRDPASWRISPVGNPEHATTLSIELPHAVPPSPATSWSSSRWFAGAVTIVTFHRRRRLVAALARLAMQGSLPVSRTWFSHLGAFARLRLSPLQVFAKR